MSVRIQEQDFDVSSELAALRAGDKRVGAVATFVGVVRDLNDAAQVSTLTLEHYPGMTEKALAQIVDDAKQRWDIYDALVIHRVGPLKPKRPDRARRGHQCTPRRVVRRVPVHHGLPQDPRALLEKRTDAGRRALGRGARQRRRRRRTLVAAPARISHGAPIPFRFPAFILRTRHG